MTTLAPAQRLGLGLSCRLALVAMTVACNRDMQASATESQTPMAPKALTAAAKPTPKPAALQHISAPGRVIAIGDLHGDLAATRRAFQTAKVTDEADHWIGGNSVVVQTGDLLDRGDEERPLLEWIERLAGIAKAGGGALYRVNGNHEMMNVAGDLRYVTDAGFAQFAEYAQSPGPRPLSDVPPARRGRLVAFLPGGPWARRLAQHPLVLIVNDSVFTHGGLVPKHLAYGLERLNAELSAWMRGTGQLSPLLAGEEAPFWDRTYGDSVAEADCRTLDLILAQLAAKRLVVGHTPQKGGISFACDKHVARIDVGLSSYYGNNPTTVLEIHGDNVNVLTSGSATKRVAPAKPTPHNEAHPY